MLLPRALVLEWTTLLSWCAGYPWSLRGSPALLRPSGLVWSGVDDCVRGTWRPILHGEAPWWKIWPRWPETWVSFDGIAFVTSQDVPERDLVSKKQYSWLSASTTWTRGGIFLPIPQDTSLCQEFAFSHPLFTFPHFILQLVSLYILRVVSC